MPTSFRSSRSFLVNLLGIIGLAGGWYVWHRGLWNIAIPHSWSFRPIILISGCRRTSPKDIIQLLQEAPSPATSSTASPRLPVRPSLTTCAQRILSMPWVSRVTLVRLWPWHLLIQIQEKNAVAIWQNKGTYHLIAHDGSTIPGVSRSTFSSLPIMTGEGCLEHLGALLEHLRSVKHFLGIKGASYLRCGSWVLYHGSKGGRILLPANQVQKALRHLDQYWSVVQHADVIDLRSPHALIYTGVP